MTRHSGGRRALVLVALLPALASTACGGSDPASPRAAASASPSGDDGDSTVSAAPSPSPTDPATVVPSPGSTQRPGTRSGGLSKRSFPRPRQLGAEWHYLVDSGSAEAGYAGNGTPALARQPSEVVQTSVPIGCARPGSLPQPHHALEVDYTVDRSRVVTVRMAFSDRATARRFFRLRSRAVRRCDGVDGGSAVGSIVGDVTRRGPGVLVDERSPDSHAWAELSLVDGRDVVLLAAQGHLGDPPMTQRDQRRIVAAFRD